MAQIEGRHPVLEALRAGRPVREVLLAAEARPAPVIGEIERAARARGVPVRRVPRREVEARATSQNPQGVIAVVASFAYASPDDVRAAAAARGEHLMALALDGITDPHNVGALARSAEASGMHGMFIPDRRGAGVTPTVEKAAAGALAYLPVVRAGNLATTLAELRRAGVWTIVLDGAGEAEIWDVELASEPFCLVVGSEGHGVSRLVAERADVRARIAMSGRVGSLNASVAGSVAMFALRRRREGHPL